MKRIWPDKALNLTANSVTFFMYCVVPESQRFLMAGCPVMLAAGYVVK